MKNFILLALVAVVTFSCLSADERREKRIEKQLVKMEKTFVQTGGDYAPLDSGETQEIFIDEKPSFEFKKIGLVSIGNDITYGDTI